MAAHAVSYYNSLVLQRTNLLQIYSYNKNFKPGPSLGQKFLLEQIPVRLSKLYTQQSPIIKRCFNFHSINTLLKTYENTCSTFYNQKVLTSTVLQGSKDELESNVERFIRSTKCILTKAKGSKDYHVLEDLLNDVSFTHICTRVLFDQLLHTFDPNYKTPTYRTNVNTIVLLAFEDARSICVEKFGEAPNIVFKSDAFNALSVDYYLHFVLVELFKNALAATVTHGNNGDIEASLYVQGDKLFVKISDKGKGLNPDFESEVFKFYETSTVEPVPTYTYSGGFGPPIEGLGVGLPFSRQYAKFLGGDVTIESKYGEGCNTTFSFNRHGINCW